MGTINSKQAIGQLETLARIVCNGDNTGNVHVGLMQQTDGSSRIVKFDAGKSKELTKDMQKSCDALRKAIGEWADAVKGHDAVWGALARQFMDCESTRADELKNALAEVCDPSVCRDDKMPIGKPIAFKTAQKVLATDETFTYRPQKMSKRGREIGRAVAQRSPFANFAHAIGRGIMRVTHAIKAFFKGRVWKKDWNWSAKVSGYSGVFGGENDIGGEEQIKKWTVGPLKHPIPVKFDASVVASSCGLVGDLVIRPFAKNEPLYPTDGEPSICDIKQNPDLQDCWFLASVAAVLRSQGPSYIKSLIDTKTEPGQAIVRLGTHQYRVPLGDVLVDGQKVVSDSKPWVRILEQAMAMHLNQQNLESGTKALGPDGERVRMSYGGSVGAIEALLGREPSTPGLTGIVQKCNPLTVEDVEKCFHKGALPVVMGSNGEKAGMLAALGTGISPGHACTVLAVDDEHRYVTVLDPYGHVRHVSESDLKNFTLVVVDEDRWNERAATNAEGKDDTDFIVETGEIEGVEVDDDAGGFVDFIMPKAGNAKNKQNQSEGQVEHA